MYKSNSNIKKPKFQYLFQFFMIQRLTKRWELPEQIKQEHSASLGTPAQRIHSVGYQPVEGPAPQELSVCECPQNTASLCPSDISSLSSPVWKISNFKMKFQKATKPPPPHPYNTGISSYKNIPIMWLVQSSKRDTAKWSSDRISPSL